MFGLSGCFLTKLFVLCLKWQCQVPVLLSDFSQPCGWLSCKKAKIVFVSRASSRLKSVGIPFYISTFLEQAAFDCFFKGFFGVYWCCNGFTTSGFLFYIMTGKIPSKLYCIFIIVFFIINLSITLPLSRFYYLLLS